MVIDARSPLREAPAWAFQIPAALIYGLNFFLIIVEGLTWPIGLPFALLAGLLPLLFFGNRLSGKPVKSTFTIAHLIAALLTIGWWICLGAPLEFSAVGII